MEYFYYFKLSGWVASILKKYSNIKTIKSIMFFFLNKSPDCDRIMTAFKKNILYDFKNSVFTFLTRYRDRGLNV